MRLVEGLVVVEPLGRAEVPLGEVLVAELAMGFDGAKAAGGMLVDFGTAAAHCKVESAVETVVGCRSGYCGFGLVIDLPVEAEQVGYWVDVGLGLALVVE